MKIFQGICTTCFLIWSDLVVTQSQGFLAKKVFTLRSGTIFGNWKPSKMMKNVFHFTSKALFVLKIFKFLSWLFGHAAKRLDKKDQVSFKFYDVAAWLIFWCFVPVGKRSNSGSQMFYKTDAITNLAIFTRKHLCWSFFLINLIKKRLQHRCFPVNIAKCLSTVTYIERLLFIKLFQNFMRWWNSLDVFGYKFIFFMFLVPLLYFPS